MKRIPLQVYNFANSLRPIAHFLLKSKDLDFSIPIIAIVDTGSPITLIGISDLKRMRLSNLQLNKLIGKNNEVNIGGGKVVTRILEEANLKFGTDLNINMPIQFPINSNENSFQPSLLGVDFMLRSKSKISF
ncbi:MAG: hypothetical protein AABX88_00500 [Nanoarchaeota archaeon]